MISTFQKAAFACLVALGLTGCQSTTPLNLAASSSIQAAGFQPASAQGANFGGLPTAAAAYMCPADRCGALTVLIFASTTAPANSLGITAEDAVRRNIYNAAALKPLLEQLIIGKITEQHPGTTGRITNYSIDPKSASQRFSARIVDAKGSPAFASGYGRFIGNETRMVVTISGKAASAARYARPGWLN